jgi:hypothetical protein
MKRRYLFIMIVVLLTQSCGIYSFSGASIPPDVKTITIKSFVNRTSNSSVTLDRIMTEEVRQKLAVESGLSLATKNGDYQIAGNILSYAIVPITPTDGTFSTKNRITLVVEVQMINNKDEKGNWTQNFTQYIEYENQNISTIEESLLTQLSKLIAQDVFNKMFSNW